MRIGKIQFEIYKWIPYTIMVNGVLKSCFYSNNTKELLGHLFIYALLFIPFIYVHSAICRHIYTKCRDKKGGNFYEF